MTALITYAGKGSGLTYGEMDQNWNTLETRTGAGWNDLVSDVTIHTGTNAPNWSNYRDGLYGFAFSPDVMNECFVNFHLRHDYVDGTMVYPHVHWTHNTTNTGTVRWGVEWTFARRGDTGSGTIDFGPTQTLYIEHNIDSAAEQYRHHVNESTEGNGIYMADFMVDGIIMCRYFRDGGHVNDTFPDPIFLLTVDIHYQTNVMATPSRTPPFYP